MRNKFKEFVVKCQVVYLVTEGQNFGEMLKELFVELPDHPVVVGDEWELTNLLSKKGSSFIRK